MSYEFVTVRCASCEATRTVGKPVEAELPDWQCGPCRREEAYEAEMVREYEMYGRYA